MKTLTAAILGVAVSLLAATAAHADSAGLVAAYGFEEATGTAAIDSSPAGNAGVFNGATRSGSGRFGAAASFDGVNDRVDIADSDSLDLSVGMTLEAWVRPDALGWRTAILKERPGGLAYALYASTETNRPSAEIHAETRAPSAIQTGLWTHLASTYDGATLRLYVNGAQVSSRAVSGPMTISSGALRIGGNAVWSGEYFRGLIDEVRVYNRALTGLEIQTDMNAPVVSADTQPPTAPALTASLAQNDVHLSWSGATDNVGITAYRVFRDGTLLTTLGAGATSYDDVDRPNGTYRYSVAAVDDAGHSTASAEAEVTVGPDTTPPVAFFRPDCDGTKAHDEFVVRPTISDDRGSVSGRVEIDGNVLTTDLPKVIRDGFTWNTRNGYPNGPHVMKLVARDQAGNETVTECVVIVENFAVTATLATPAESATVSGTITLDADVFTDGQPIADDWSGWYPAFHPVNSVRFELDGYVGMGVPVAEDPPFTATLDTTTLTNGQHRIRGVVYWMHYGVPRATTQTVTINVDNSPSRPTGVDATVTGDDVRVSWGAVTANPAVTGYRVFRDGTQIATVTDGTAYSDDDRPAGTYEYTVVAVNSRGASQPSEPASATVEGDTTPPTVSFDYGCNGTKVHDYLDFRPLVSDDHGPVTAEVLLDGEPFPGAVGVPGPRMTIDFDTRRYGVPNGMHTMTVVARDGAGNETSAPCVWNVQNPAVTVPFTGPANGDTVRGTVDLAAHVLTDGAVPDWTGQLPVGDPVVGVSFEVVGKAQRFDTTAPYGFAWDSTTVPNGTYTVRASVQWMDYSLPRATSEIQITVDNPPPLPAPTGVAASVTGDDVTVTWDAVAGATGYRVQRGGVDVGTSTGTSFTNADVPAGTHQYRVIAVDGTRNSVPSAPVSATVAPSGLVAAYGFEQTSGTTVVDSSGRGSTGTLSGATWATGGRFGRALSFDGVNDLVTVADSDALDLAPGMTLEAWVKPTTVSDWRTVLIKERPGQLTYGLYAAGDGRPLAEVAAGTQRDARGTAALPTGVWTHLAATFDKSTLRFYVNGTQVASTAVSGTLLNSAGALRIGGNTVWGEYFSGLIDEVRVYERALSAAEIAADKDRPV